MPKEIKGIRLDSPEGQKALDEWIKGGCKVAPEKSEWFLGKCEFFSTKKGPNPFYEAFREQENKMTKVLKEMNKELDRWHPHHGRGFLLWEDETNNKAKLNFMLSREIVPLDELEYYDKEKHNQREIPAIKNRRKTNHET